MDSLGIFHEWPIAVGAIKTHGMRLAIDAYLAAFPATDPAEFVLLNLGVNDMPTLPSQAAFEEDYAYILDALHVKWPDAAVLSMHPCKRGATQCATIATWITNAQAGRAWATSPANLDESVFLENGDDYTTYTSDGAHPNVAGYALTAAQWQTAMGF